jgi:NADH:quinone reductase (non-electrogenic)
VLLDGKRVPYDMLIVATGARHAYFGQDDWEPFAPGLKQTEDATAIRRRVLLAFEHAEAEENQDERRRLLSFASHWSWSHGRGTCRRDRRAGQDGTGQRLPRD